MKETDNYGADVVITATSVPSVHTEAQIIAAKMENFFVWRTSRMKARDILILI